MKNDKLFYGINETCLFLLTGEYLVTLDFFLQSTKLLLLFVIIVCGDENNHDDCEQNGSSIEILKFIFLENRRLSGFKSTCTISNSKLKSEKYFSRIKNISLPHTLNSGYRFQLHQEYSMLLRYSRQIVRRK